MPPAIVRTIAGYTGTARELAKIAEINIMAMRRRIYQWKIGEMSEADVMCVGPLPGGLADTWGTPEWRGLSDKPWNCQVDLRSIPGMGSFDICTIECLDRPRLNGKGWG